MLLKLLALAALCVLVARLCALWVSGRRAHRGKAHERNHEKQVWLIGALSMLAVGLIECVVYASPDPYAVSIPLFVAHLALVTLLVSTYIAILARFNGRKRRDAHPRYAYSFLALYGLVIVTGAVLLYQIPI